MSRSAERNLTAGSPEGVSADSTEASPRRLVAVSRRSLFIVFEGGEGSGKSTQTRVLQRRFLSLGLSVVLTHEPGGTSLGKEVRQRLKWSKDVSPLTELLLFNAARAQLLSEVIRPSLEKGAIVICDRFADSTTAYQGYGRGLDFSTIEAANAIATQGLRPDLVILLDIPVEEGLARKRSAKLDRFEREDVFFHQRVRNGYIKMADSDPQRWLVVDGSLPKRKIADIVWQRVEGLLPRESKNRP